MTAAPADTSKALVRPDMLTTSRLTVLSAVAAACNALPLPIVPTSLERYLRGAVVYDVASRHGLSLTPEARDALALVDRADPARRMLSGAATYVIRRILRRVGPLSLLAPARAGVEVFALGILFERYIQSFRRGPSVRIHAAEARGVREAIDRAVIRVLHPSLEPTTLGGAAQPAEDLRDDWTRVLDTVLLAGASVPGYVLRRLEAAFDAVVAENPELVDG